MRVRLAPSAAFVISPPAGSAGPLKVRRTGPGRQAGRQAETQTRQIVMTSKVHRKRTVIRFTISTDGVCESSRENEAGHGREKAAKG